MTLRRQPGWERRLMEFVDATRSAPFEWSRQDCATWALRAVDAMCGTHHADAIAGQYSDAEGAVAYAASRGWQTAADACREFCGEPLERASRMQRGDVLFRPVDEFPFGMLLVYIGSGQIAAPGDDGLRVAPKRAALLGPMTAWAVGR